MSAEQDGKPRLLIVGTGAMACLFGSRLAPHADVSLLGTWQTGLDALRRRGIQLERDGRLEKVPVRATDDPGACAGSPRALVLVKSWQTERAAARLQQCLAPDGIALTLQNGIGNLEILAAALGPERTALGVTTMGATLLGPGHVRAGGEGTTHLAAHPRLGAMADLFCRAGLQTETVQDLASLLWGKLAINASINPLTALLGVRNGRLLESAPARRIMAELAEEVARVAAARGIELPFADPAAAAEDVARRTAANRSSMLQDMLRGAPTEVEAIQGAIVKAGEAAGVPTPANRLVADLVRAQVGLHVEGNR